MLNHKSSDKYQRVIFHVYETKHYVAQPINGSLSQM